MPRGGEKPGLVPVWSPPTHGGADSGQIIRMVKSKVSICSRVWSGTGAQGLIWDGFLEGVSPGYVRCLSAVVQKSLRLSNCPLS